MQTLHKETLIQQIPLSDGKHRDGVAGERSAMEFDWNNSTQFLPFDQISVLVKSLKIPKVEF